MRTVLFVLGEHVVGSSFWKLVHVTGVLNVTCRAGC
jgi:hypothetical protein